jgi:hypothetical protein
MKIDLLIEVCRNHMPPDNIDVVIREPYIPHFPDKWNNILVLAESQNLSNTNSRYVEKLKSLSTTDRFCRLRGPLAIGIQPWDDGSLKLAVEASFDISSENTAVSNAILWSQIDEFGNNKNPSNDLITLSINLWADLIQLIEPQYIITCGNYAHQVIGTINQMLKVTWKSIQLRLPSRTAMSRISNMFPEKDLLFRYPEVKEVIQKHPEWLEGGYRQNKIFFACHAVSIIKTITSQYNNFKIKC